jgi:ABC-type dipeptide/oligopeptide/nickel transport system permease subunit
MSTAPAELLPESVPAAPPRGRRPGRRWGLYVSLAFVAFYVLVAVFGPLIVDYNPVTTHLTDRLLSPGSHTSDGGTAWLGTDNVGRDILGQVIAGARTSLIVGLAAAVGAGVVGLAVGTVSGYLRGPVDAVVMRIIDIQLAFPAILLAIVIAGLFGHSLPNVVFALAVTRWIPFARVARAGTLSIRERDWVAAARVTGVARRRIIGRHILPFVLAPAIAISTIEFALIIVSEAGLSFLGVGLKSSTVSWGQTIAAGQDYLNTAWWISTIPGLALMVLVVAIGIVGDQLTDPVTRSTARTARTARSS